MPERALQTAVLCCMVAWVAGLVGKTRGQMHCRLTEVLVRPGDFVALTIKNLAPSTTYYYKCAHPLCVVVPVR